MQLKDDGELIHWTTSDGLTDNEVWSLLITDDGSLWVGTRWNLHRWNGNGWDIKGDRIGSLDADGLVIYELIETRDGTIWAATTAAIAKLEGIDWSIDQDRCGPSINSLIQDRDDNIWIGCDRGLYRWDGQDWYHYNLNKGITDSTFSYLTTDLDGKLFTATRNGIYEYDQGKDAWDVLLEF
jgi:ligand-binding sensor domain-containing protein